MRQTITISDHLYKRLETEAHRRGLTGIEDLLELWASADTSDEQHREDERVNRGQSSSAEPGSDSVYRFRAECEHDVDELRRILGMRVTKIIKINEPPFPDVTVDVYSKLSLEELRDAMRQVEDGHVMVQTVAPRATYTGERDYDLS